ncbi:hypothetical protein [Kitasatospora griseola]|uniref:hypothetical protein n=1 Tax=Kitasatospora griseola TaxID=2064 RepID=UPI000698C7ED|nr:hypothetical protein [Kitasatospora griseola]
MSDLSEYRAERRADRAAERNADRDDRREEREQARLDAEATRHRKAADRREVEEKAERIRAERRARWSRRAGWVRENPAKVFARFVMACSIVPAVISQVAALTGAGVHPALAGLLAAMLEGTAWALVAMGAAAEGERSTRTYRIGAWTAGILAAAVNAAHGLDQYKAHPWVAAVLALSSLVAVWIVDLQTHGGHGPTLAERKTDKERAAHGKRRAVHHPEVKAVADRLLSAAEHGALATHDAWRIAWEYVQGVTVPGLTADLLARRLNARARVAELSTLPAPVDMWPGMPDDPFPAITIPLPSGPSDSVYLDTIPEPLGNASGNTIESLNSLAGKGIQPLDGSSGEGTSGGLAGGSGNDERRPLDATDLARVRALAATLTKTGQALSTRKVRDLIGCRNEYAVRLRAAIEAEETQ